MMKIWVKFVEAKIDWLDKTGTLLWHTCKLVICHPANLYLKVSLKDYKGLAKPKLLYVFVCLVSELLDYYNPAAKYFSLGYWHRGFSSTPEIQDFIGKGIVPLVAGWLVLFFMSWAAGLVVRKPFRASFRKVLLYIGVVYFFAAVLFRNAIILLGHYLEPGGIDSSLMISQELYLLFDFSPYLVVCFIILYLFSNKRYSAYRLFVVRQFLKRIIHSGIRLRASLVLFFVLASISIRLVFVTRVSVIALVKQNTREAITIMDTNYDTKYFGIKVCPLPDSLVVLSGNLVIVNNDIDHAVLPADSVQTLSIHNGQKIARAATLIDASLQTNFHSIDLRNGFFMLEKGRYYAVSLRDTLLLKDYLRLKKACKRGNSTIQYNIGSILFDHPKMLGCIRSVYFIETETLHS